MTQSGANADNGAKFANRSQFKSKWGQLNLYCTKNVKGYEMINMEPKINRKGAKQN